MGLALYRSRCRPSGFAPRGGAIKRRGFNSPVGGYDCLRCEFSGCTTNVPIIFLTFYVACARKSPITCGPQGNMVSRCRVELQGGESVDFQEGNAPDYFIGSEIARSWTDAEVISSSPV